MLQCRPFLKWAGGKQRCLPHILPQIPKAKRLVEPFVGAGTIFLNSDFSSYLLGELNQDLVNLYKTLRDEHVSFIDYCATYFTGNYADKTSYYSLRNQFNQTKDTREKAALFLYLNRHGFNGLCRYNSSGGFNVPFGDSGAKGPYFPQKELSFFANKARNVDFICQDFRSTFAAAQQGDVIYCDPPYAPLGNEDKPFKYHALPFGLEEQQTLADYAEKANKKSIPVIISNHDTPFTREIYHKARIISFPVRRFISCNGANRQAVRELVAIYE